MVKTNVIVRPAVIGDLPRIAELNAQIFLGNRGDLESAIQWVTCLFRSHPRGQYYVAEESDGKSTRIVGYIYWEIHGGFLRAEPAVELEQLAIHPACQGRGLALELIDKSADKLMGWILEINNRIESGVTFFVWAYANNFNAMKVYSKWFGEPTGFRIQYGERAENMWRRKITMVREARF